MKRLTKRIDGKAAFVHGTCYDPQQVCDFLAAYEDTGLEPEVCANYKQFEDEAMSKGVTFRRIVELMESVRYGLWIRGGANDMHGFDFHCSECNKSFHLGSLATIYDVKREWIHCPNCGAKMDGEKEGV